MLLRLLIILLLVSTQQAFSGSMKSALMETLPSTQNVTQHFETQVKLAILIDDMGHSVRSNKQALALPGPVSYAFLPFARYSKEMALSAKKLDRDVLLHAPMENIHNIPLGPGGMTSDMSESDFKQMLHRDIDAIPHLVGVNNHMGSQLTAQREPMRWTMDVLKARGLFFVDSRTTPLSVAWQQAIKAGMVGVKRDVFLDHELNASALRRQFLQAIARAKHSGYALMIAHPHRLSLNFLRDNLSSLKAQGVRLISVTQLVAHIKQRELAQANNLVNKKAF